jgi:hypothetical protein
LIFSFFLGFPGTCENGGTWTQGQCICLSGFSGDRCQQQNINCQNEGTWDGFKCICPNTFYGSFCEFPVEELELGELLEPYALHFFLQVSVSVLEAPCTILIVLPSLTLLPCPVWSLGLLFIFTSKWQLASDSLMGLLFVWDACVQWLLCISLAAETTQIAILQFCGLEVCVYESHWAEIRVSLELYSFLKALGKNLFLCHFVFWSLPHPCQGPSHKAKCISLLSCLSPLVIFL